MPCLLAQAVHRAPHLTPMSCSLQRLPLLPALPTRQAIGLDNLKHLAVLGSGAFGRVTLVQYEGRYFALKTLSKAHVVQTGLQVGVLRQHSNTSFGCEGAAVTCAAGVHASHLAVQHQLHATLCKHPSCTAAPNPHLTPSHPTPTTPPHTRRHPPTQQEHIKRERALMAEMSCPFLVDLAAAFQARDPRQLLPHEPLQSMPPPQLARAGAALAPATPLPVPCPSQ